MSSHSLAFALKQKQLDTIDQLALIIIADSCGDYFTLSDAIIACRNHTNMNTQEASSAVTMLRDDHILRVKSGEDKSNADALHFIMVVHNG